MRQSTTPHPDGVKRLRRLTPTSPSVIGLRPLVGETSARNRVCLYVSAVGGQRPEVPLEVARLFAVEQGWRVGDSFVDFYLWSTCAARPGWGRVRAEVGAGRADGVVVLSRAAVHVGPGEFDAELAWFSRHFGFIAEVSGTVECVVGR